MQVARYWRMKKVNYRLEGVRYPNGAVSLQPRPSKEGLSRFDQEEVENTDSKPEEKSVLPERASV